MMAAREISEKRKMEEVGLKFLANAKIMQSNCETHLKYCQELPEHSAGVPGNYI